MFEFRFRYPWFVNKNSEFFINSYKPGIAAVGKYEREKEKKRESE